MDYSVIFQYMNIIHTDQIRVTNFSIFVFGDFELKSSGY
jgi:hypothetical protein